VRSVVLALVVLVGCGPAVVADSRQNRCGEGCDKDLDGYPPPVDCDDTDSSLHPGADELCDGIDNDCDALVDDDDPDREAQVRYLDRDGDGAGDPLSPMVSCDSSTSVAEPNDCNDADNTVHPGAAEWCDGVDNDCDGLVDDEQPGVLGTSAWYPDDDGDGFGALTEPYWACTPPPGSVVVGGDCEDDNLAVRPLAPPICDGVVDNDCDGVDEENELDRDGDGETPCDGDCDDRDPVRAASHREVCNGVDDDCDGKVDMSDPSIDRYSCGWCPEPAGFAQTPPIAESYNPCLLDPEVRALCRDDPSRPDTHVSGERLHRVRFRDDIEHRRQLFLFFPPGPGGSNGNIIDWAAYAGFKVISLGHDNSVVLKNFCAKSPEERCYGDARDEIVYGLDLSDEVDVPYADGVVRRLEVLLAHLTTTHPGEGWEHYLSPGGVVWEDVVVAGWSRGAGSAATIARDHKVDGAVLFSGPQDRVGEEEPVAAPWTAEPRRTPGCAHYAAYHTDERHELFLGVLDSFGLSPEVAQIDSERPPYGGAQILTTALFEPGKDWCDEHQSMGMDECMRDEMIEPYLYMMCSAGDADPNTCR
jgi:hypothetical protein